jgi:hypothetical protein
MTLPCELGEFPYLTLEAGQLRGDDDDVGQECPEEDEIGGG